MVSKLNDFKEVIGDTSEQYAGSVPIIITEGQLLHMGKYISSHVRFNKCSVAMTDYGYKILENCAEQISSKNDSHDSKKCRIHFLRQETVHSFSCNIRKCQIDQGDADRKKHVCREHLFMR